MRALISVSDKSGISEFAKELENLGWEIISTGNTHKKLLESGVSSIEVSDITKFPEILGGRVKTLNPLIHGGILYRRDDEEDKKTIEIFNIEPIDMVVTNLYPFKEAYDDESLSDLDKIEQIDIGGPAMIRAAAKNYKFVNIIVNASDYDLVLKELRESGETSLETRKYLAMRAFAHTAEYDSIISKYFNEINEKDFADNLSLSFNKVEDLRYGENPHQKASLYKSINSKDDMKIYQGKSMSYNNLCDYNEAINMIKDFEEPTAIAIKHGSPSGIASSNNINDAYKKAYNADPKSIFGGIVIVNRDIDLELAIDMNRTFLEIIIAPKFTEKALEEFRKKKDLRIVEDENIYNKDKSEKMMKILNDKLLVQEYDRDLDEKFEYITENKPSDLEIEEIKFAWKVVKNAKSNAIVIAKDKASLGIGQGQVSRIWALENAIKQAKEFYDGDFNDLVLASDGFFPFEDCIEIAKKNGIMTIVQPGGSKNDDLVIKKANEYGMKMVFTGRRHFRH
ncbi:MAG: bifunctional phosphoribosylaminoimidazolecarboxamide formyltransferase/IMP cyclohydrolase [Andreesenia angusta]|nr:bifunctional phosphoribosylaminoimidazolecarboxamide formyltransferase/IMP cyclohydrolase [Andreesenia angusta]